MVQVKTLALAVGDLQLLGVAVFQNLHGHAGIDARQHTDQTVPDVIALGDFPGDVVLAADIGPEVADLSTPFACQSKRGVHQPSRDLFAMLSEVLERDAVEPQITLQAPRISNAPKRARQEQTVKAAQGSGDDRTKSA